MVREKFDMAFIIKNFPKLLGALPVTLLIMAVSLLAGWLLGLLAAAGKVKGPGWLKKVLQVLTDVIRGIPTVILLYLVYFGLPVTLKNQFGINVSHWSKMVYVIIALTIEIGTTASEMFRSAYNAIPRGQLEAAHALGYTGWQRFIHIIFPQGIFVILPNLGSAVLAAMQSTALVYTLGIYDVLGKARQIDTNITHAKTFEMYFAAALIYWGMAILINGVFKCLEKIFGKGSRSVAQVIGTNTKKAAV